MKIIHTADLHLKKGFPDRIEILRWIIDQANTHKAKGIIIAGDLFDSNEDATALRSKTKQVFEDATSTIYIIPGNHDAGSYGEEYDYGSNVVQLTETPNCTFDIDGLPCVAVPFQAKTFSECARDLPKDITILIAHGTLYDPSYIFSVIDDIETKYMPIFPKNLENRAQYVALGHLHSRYLHLTYQDTQIVYPGSPIPLDTKCSSPRACALVTLDDHQITIECLEVDRATYWEEKEFFVFPGNEDRIIDKIRQHLKLADPARVQPHIIVNGLIGIGDKEYTRSLDTITAHFSPLFKNFMLDTSLQSWDKMMEHSVVKQFIRKTEILEEPLRMKLYEITFPILSKALR